MKAARNLAIILALAALVTLAPGGLTARDTVANIITVVFLAGIAFFAYRLYMEHRVALFDLPEQTRLLLYGSATALAFALVATRKFWDESGVYILLWFALIGLAAYGLVVVVRRWREY
jgi:heme/copper-type cytochrome/quinol oxidase subunit 4